MARLKSKDILKLAEQDKKDKLEELRTELVRASVEAGKSGKTRVKEIRKTIARILTLMPKKASDNKI